MEKITICYEFNFTLTIRKKNGKLYKGHHQTGIGLNFRLAFWDVYQTLKKRRSDIIGISSVKPLRIAFAFDGAQQSLRLQLKDHPPEMPEDYEKEIENLPKK